MVKKENFAKVYVDGSYQLLEPGTHSFNTPQFKYDGMVKQNSEYIGYGDTHQADALAEKMRGDLEKIKLENDATRLKFEIQLAEAKTQDSIKQLEIERLRKEKESELNIKKQIIEL